MPNAYVNNYNACSFKQENTVIWAQKGSNGVANLVDEVHVYQWTVPLDE